MHWRQGVCTIKSLHSIVRTTTFEGTLLTIKTDRSKEKETTVMGFIIYGKNGGELICWGDIDYGPTSNKVRFVCYFVSTVICSRARVEMCGGLHPFEE